MSNIVYAWNPFQERVDTRIKNEIIKTSTISTRKEFVPRAAPFYARNFNLRVQGASTDLKFGVDYVFAHPFGSFVTKYSRNCFGSVVLLKDFTNKVLLGSYDTIGGPFVLDQIAFAELVANIVNNPRIADWGDLVNVPGEFPPDPHDHPAVQTYDYHEMMTSLTSLVLNLTNANQDVDLKALFDEHIGKPLIEAHTASKADIALDDTPNMGPATNADLAGNSANVVITMAVFKEGLRQLANGTLKLD